MIAHILKYRLKCFLKDKQMLFWTFAFPLLLATLFNLAFSNLSHIDEYIQAKVAVVNNAEYRGNIPFREALEAVSSEGGIFITTVVSERQEAEALLDGDKIDGYIYLDSGIKLTVKRTGLNQTIIRSFLDDYSQTYRVVTRIMAVNPEALAKGLDKIVQDRGNYLEEVPASKASPDSTVIYFYSLIAMAALYGGFWGIRAVAEAQADLSPQGARLNISPVHKFKQLICDLSAAVLIQYAEILVLIAYIKYILGYDFGNNIGYVLLAAFAACFMGMAFGVFIGAAVRKGEGVKTAVLISASMIMSLLSGMMFSGIKYIITEAFPAMSWLNPSNLVTDAFYALYYYDTYEKYFSCVAGLFAYGAIFSLISYILLRKRRYESV